MMIQNLVVAFIWIFIVGGVTLIFISFVTERAKTRQSIDDALDEQLGGAAQTDPYRDWPLIARLAKDIFSVGKGQEDQDSLADRIRKAGYPVNSVAQFYVYKLGLTFFYGFIGLLFMLLLSFADINLGPWIIIFVSIGFAFFGNMQPDSEIRSGIKKRHNRLVLDMTYNLPRLVTIMSAQGDLVSALTNLAQSKKNALSDTALAKHQEELAQAKSEMEREARVAWSMLQGFAGDLFAEVVNRLASELTKEPDAAKAAAEVRRHYPYTTELERFLTIVEVSMDTGSSFQKQFNQLATELLDDLEARQQEMGQQALMYATLGQGLLFPILMGIILIPIFLQAMSFLR